MAVRISPVEDGKQKGKKQAGDLAAEFRGARRAAGLSQREIATAVGVTHATISRFERGATVGLSFERLGAMCACVALDLSVRAYAGGDPLRDAAQIGVREAFHLLAHASLGYAQEVGLPIPGDRRAWDAMVFGRDWRVGVEVETRLVDYQAFERRISLKQRDGEVETVIVVLLDSRANRTVLRRYADEIAVTFPVPESEIVAALKAGTKPRGNGIILLKPAEKAAAP